MSTAIAHFRDILRVERPRLAVKYHVASLGLFGSRVRGEARPESDLDVLVSFDEAPTLLRFIELEQELTDLLGVKVDLVMRESLKPEIGQRVMQELLAV